MSQENAVAPIPPRAVVRFALRVRAWLLRLADLIVPPQARLIELGFGHQGTMLLHTAAKLRIADHLGDGAKTARELAEIVSADADSLHRMLRCLAMYGAFTLDEAGYFRNNRLSRGMIRGTPGSMWGWLNYSGSKANMAAWADFPSFVATGKNSFETVHGRDCWAYLSLYPEEGEYFDQAMVDLTDMFAPVIAGAYDFSKLGIVCDVAGGRGALLAAILGKYSGPRGWLVDAPRVLEHANTLLSARGMDRRVELRPGNMFADIPRGADAYLMKDILHDWDDARSLQILENCRRAMDPGKRLLLVEIVVGENETSMPGPAVDLHMAVATCDGRQRSRADFERLFAKSGFRLERIVETAVPSSIVEAIAI
jgi:hypothetical protein